MYELGKNQKSRGKTIFLSLTVLFLLLVAATAVAAKLYLKPNTVVSQSDGVIRHVSVEPPKTMHISNSLFKLDLPVGWHKSKNTYFAPPADYGWQGKGDDAARRLDIYVDDIPATMPLNHLQPVSRQGNRLALDGSVSENCVNFTDETEQSKHTGQAPAKWSGVTFYCDTGNYSRDVVGTSSKNGVNSVELTSSKNGSHKFFFVYTDNSASADYSVFQNILQSFRLK